MNLIPKPLLGAARSSAIAALMAWERLESGVSYNPISNKLREYPYGKYDELRRKDPVHRMRMIDGWAITGYDDVNNTLRDTARFAKEPEEFIEYPTMLGMNPPDHTRLRALVSRAFTPRSVRELGPRVQQIVDDLLDAVEDRERFDLIEAFAYPLPVTVIAEMLGVPPEDMDRFDGWSNDISLSIEPKLNEDQARRVQDAGDKLNAYFDEIIELRRASPRDDMITALIAAEDEGDRLTHGELLGTLLLLLVAGNETTRNLIGNGMLALMKHPDQLRRLRDNPDLLDSAIAEMLRYDSPVQLDGRMAMQDTEIGGKPIRAGQRVLSLIGAANRDPSAFDNPNEFDIGRRQKSHISFGRGIHHCLGAPLATLEGRIAFSGLLNRFSSIRLLEEPEHREQVVLRGVKELWVEVER